MTTSGRKVLVIDDDPTLQLLVKDYLGGAGYVVRVAEDGLKGRKFATSFSPDIIFLDLIMPSCDGYELCAQLKNDPETAHIPIVLMTGSRGADVIQRGLEVGATDFITKPVDWEFLKDRVNHVLSQGTGGSQVATDEPNPLHDDQEREVARLEEENNALKESVSCAEIKIAELSKQLSAIASAEQDATGQSVSHLHAQISQIENEWSERLQQALSQAQSRADERITEIQAQLKAKDEEISVLTGKLEQQRADAATDSEASMRKLREELEEEARNQITQINEDHEKARSEIHAAQSTREQEVWRFVSDATADYKRDLRRSQLAVAELQQNLLDGSAVESVMGRVDILTTLLVGNLRNVSALNEVTQVANVDQLDGGDTSAQLDKVVERSAGDAKIRCNRPDVHINTGLHSGCDVTVDENRLGSAITNILETCLRSAPRQASIEVKTDAANAVTLKITNALVKTSVSQDLNGKQLSIEDLLVDDCKAARMSLWVGKNILAQIGATVSVEHHGDSSADISIAFPEWCVRRPAEQHVEQVFAEAV